MNSDYNLPKPNFFLGNCNKNVKLFIGFSERFIIIRVFRLNRKIHLFNQNLRKMIPYQ